MTPAIDACARMLLEARQQVRLLTELPDDIRPATLADAYTVQARLIQLSQDEVVGWKVGATSVEVQKLFRVSEPVYGPIFSGTASALNVLTSPARFNHARFQHRLLESEFAFRFGAPLPSRSRRYTRAEIMDAVDAVIPAIEIISPRFTHFTVDRIPQLVADCTANGGAVLGTPCTSWRGLDLAAHEVSLSSGGSVLQAGSGALVLGHPLTVLDWFVNALTARGLSIAAGQFVMTGTMTGLHAVDIGETARADFGSLGTVEITFEA